MATIDLQKKSVKVVLEKKNLVKVTARVGLVLDITGSMRNFYKNGTVQKVVERILAMASLFDDDGVLDVWVYDNEFSRLKPVTERDFEGYVDRIILEDELVHKFGRNDEPPVMKDVLKKYLEEDPSLDPAYIVFINDGGCKKSIKPLIENSAKYPIFWQFVGIGNGNFDFLRKLDTLEGRVVDNANFLYIEEIDKISDDQLYNALLTEFPSWLEEAKQKGIVQAKKTEQKLSAQQEPNKQGFFGKLFGR
ncbi:VWA domain-containing protein [Neobacillus sp. OS1-2]|uniref:vWA domain-containing protein n=1 Tax=Neobacillus sp. OS1-2 TaxID=3070680 RepID=UPI0027DFD0E1|nr:VWA domain-containing protein [Neobacillus sp. OS1-2]WML38272.1 VWA domain-containing protein [Neobacillus sp. OS1-2]